MVGGEDAKYTIKRYSSLGFVFITACLASKSYYINQASRFEGFSEMFVGLLVGDDAGFMQGMWGGGGLAFEVTSSL